MKIPTKSLLAAVAAVPLVAGDADAAVVNSTGTAIAAWDFVPSGTSSQVGDLTHTDGLQINGFTGTWGSVLPSGPFERTGTSNGYTFRWNVGDAATTWGWTGASSPPVRTRYEYVNTGGERYSGAVPWRIEGLTPGTQYDVILLGTARGSGGNGGTENSTSLFSITGFNGGTAATLDAEGDGNFQGVVADGSGYISGFFDSPASASEARITGVQIAEVPEPGSIALLAVGGLLMARRRRG